MKKDNLLYVILFVGLSLLSCQKDKPTEQPQPTPPPAKQVYDLKLSTTTLTITEGEENWVVIESGNPAYTVTVTNSNIATAVVTGTTSVSVQITAIAEGTATIVVSDSQSKTFEIGLIVEASPFELQESGGEVILTLKEGAEIPSGAIKIPAKATAIDDEVFMSNIEITSVEMPNVKRIGKRAFRAAANLKKIVLKEVQQIEEQAFISCGLKELTLPATVERIGRMAFMNNNELKKITVLNPTPPVIYGNTFAGNVTIKKKRELYVPESALKAYQENEQWSANFSTIKAISK